MLPSLVEGGSLLPARRSAQALLEAFMRGKSENTMAAYRSDLRHFAAWLARTRGLRDEVGAACAHLVGASSPEAHELVWDYVNDQLEEGLSVGTANRRLYALRSLLKFGRMLGYTTFILEIAPQRAKRYRDTRGPGREGVRALLKVRRNPPTTEDLRNAALLHLLYDLALRRHEALSLDVEHVDLVERRISVVEKGSGGERVALSLPEPTARALEAWLAERGGTPGAVFYRLDRARRPAERQRLSGRSCGRLLARLSLKAGIGLVRPHGLRHAAITAALDATHGDVRAVQKFSRHRKIDTVLIYDDTREDLGGKVANLVAEAE